MSNLTDLLPAGAGGKQVSFVASGTIGNGVTVGLNSDGTVSALSSFGATTPATFESATTTVHKTLYHPPSGNIFIFYQDGGNSNYFTYVGCSISGGTISYGTPTVASSYSISINYPADACYDSTSGNILTVNKLNTVTTQRVTEWSVSGTTLSSVQFNNSNSSVYPSLAHDPVNNQTILAFQSTASNTAKVIVLDGSLQIQSNTEIYAAQTYDSALVYHEANDVFIYVSGTSLSSINATAFTVSGTTVTAGATTASPSGSSYRTNGLAVYDPDSEQVIAVNSYWASVISLSGTTPSFNTVANFTNSSSRYPRISYNTSDNKIIVAFQDGNNAYATSYIEGTVSGTSVTFGSPILVSTNNSTDASYPSVAYGEASGVPLIAYTDNTDSNYGKASLYLKTPPFLGISDAAISDTASGSVTIKGGISTNVTGLTANQNYYVQDDGSLSTTTSTVLAGKALSSTSINLDYTT